MAGKPRDPNAPKKPRAPQKALPVYLVITCDKSQIAGAYRDAEDAFDKAEGVEGARLVKVSLPPRGKVGTVDSVSK